MRHTLSQLNPVACEASMGLSPYGRGVWEDGEREFPVSSLLQDKTSLEHRVNPVHERIVLSSAAISVFLRTRV